MRGLNGWAGGMVLLISMLLPWHRAVGDERIGMVLGQAMLAIEGMGADPRVGLDGLERAAAAGDGLAALNLAVAYQTGVGIPRDSRRAFHWLQNITTGASVARLTPELVAWVRLKTGLAYLGGDGVEVDRRQARRWLLKAAVLESAYAEYMLGRMDEEGTDRVAARNWYRRSAARGFVPAQEALKRLDGL
ncbi:MAG: sel1 repeat family protein [Magnetococcales bacterium]|nr:sel1 repeat family protein [Magnetococcales bacterium]MBF0151247.1 sel1 repeat family protein [Magnetococcales bacterium]MBF0174372.1 sel1 repeat family protein [Magnetococcales bacterium]MBF0632793.1 sel1 repeat family protein [Magnetococcales bacterium]